MFEQEHLLKEYSTYIPVKNNLYLLSVHCKPMLYYVMGLINYANSNPFKAFLNQDLMYFGCC